MVVISVTCPHCGSPDIVKNGHAPNGKQKYRCRACGRQSRENPTPHVTPQARREEILRAYQEHRSLRGLNAPSRSRATPSRPGSKRSSHAAAAGHDPAAS
jgi:transposase-like protein